MGGWAWCPPPASIGVILGLSTKASRKNQTESPFVVIHNGQMSRLLAQEIPCVWTLELVTCEKSVIMAKVHPGVDSLEVGEADVPRK